MTVADLIAPTLTVLAGLLLVMGAAWVVQRAVNNAGWIDVFWTLGTGLACVAAALWPSEAANTDRQILVATLAALWSLRLGGFIAVRVASSQSEDVRYANMRKDWGASFQPRMALLALPQAPATALLAVSVFVAAHGGGAAFGERDAAGALLLLLAIGGEALADNQMRAFKTRAEKGSIMREGLWSWSRHPNYFFEWLGWLAYPVIAFNPDQPLTYLTFVAPALMYLILRYVTGVPALEAAMLRSRGDGFRRYQRQVSAFFPLPPRSGP